jgi:fluoride exporter
LVFSVLTERLLPDPDLRVAITVGFIGAYSTFSALTLDTVQLLQAGAMRSAALNLAVSLAAGLAAAWFGIMTGRAI